MKKSQIVGGILVASLMLGTPVMALTESPTAKVLTVEEAIKKAKTVSIKLDQNKRIETLRKDEADYAELLGGWNERQQKDVDRRYTQLENSVIEEQIARNVKKMFDDILYTEQNIKTLEKKIGLQEKQINKAQLEKNLGKISNFSLEQINLEYEQTKQAKLQTEQELQVKYSSLESLVGNIGVKNYVLQKEKNAFKPFELVGSLEAFADTRAETDLSLWKAKEDARVAKNPIYTYDWMDIVQKREERASKEDKVKLTKQQLEQEIKDNYAQVKQLESKYIVDQENLKIKEKEFQISQIQLKSGMISQLEYETKLVELENSKDQIDSVINKHTYLKQLLEKPYLQ